MSAALHCSRDKCTKTNHEKEELEDETREKYVQYSDRIYCVFPLCILILTPRNFSLHQVAFVIKVAPM